MLAAILPLPSVVTTTPAPRIRKPKVEKPYPEFPLTPHPSGLWCKKIKGKLHYFGTIRDPQAALNKYLDQKDDLHAGRTPRVQGDGLTLRELCVHFLTVKKLAQEAGELSKRSYEDYAKTCERLAAALGGTRAITDLHPDDFTGLRAAWAKKWGPATIAGEVQRVRVLFKHGYDAALIEKPIRFGPGFKRPSKKTLRATRAAKGPQMFEAKEIKAMLAAAGPSLKAMILLGINCGFGNNDCGRLPLAAVDLKDGWIRFARPKTGIDRRCPLWPETVQALKAAIAKRREAKDPADDGLLFITKYGGNWHKDQSAITKEFRKLLNELTIGGRRNFYALRHTFETIGGDSKDQVAVDFLMGHAKADMASLYRERVFDHRLKAVVGHIWRWLFGRSKKL